MFCRTALKFNPSNYDSHLFVSNFQIKTFEDIKNIFRGNYLNIESHIRMISEESCATENWVMTAENSAFPLER